MNPLIERIYQSNTVEDAEGNSRDLAPGGAIAFGEGKALYDLVRSKGCCTTLEIGMSFGLSSLFICQAHQDNGGGNHTAIDPWQEKWFKSIGRFNIKQAGFSDFVRFFDAPSYEILPDLLRNGEHFDFVFIDGNHRFEYVFTDFFYADLLIEPGGHVMFHDLWMPSIRKVVSYILRSRPDAYQLEAAFMGPRAGILRGCQSFLHHLRASPYDVCVARTLARRNFANYSVFRKIAARPPEEIDADWQFYRSF